jgi:hypothetical protein
MLKGETTMKNKTNIYITAEELSELLGISIGQAYRIIRGMNQELQSDGYLVIAGKVPRRYFEKRWYGYGA